jgi:cysteine desulfurase / selenocysteine lyase
MFDKSESTFPAKKNSLFFAHCAISPLQRQAKDAAQGFLEAMAAGGISGLPPYFNLLPQFHKKCGKLLQTGPENISFVHNTAEAMCLLANGYPFQAGDEVVSYVHEFPSNHYPWRLQEKRGVKLVLLGDSDPLGSLGDVSAPRGWSMAELEGRVTPRTRVIALSHVQFANGYAADLRALGAFCREHAIDLIIDGAQSLGCLPLYPEEYHVAAVAASGWKWLMGPFGSGILYTSPALREKVELTMVGPYCMQQELDYLDHRWNPHADGRKFEYSTLAWEHVAALNGVLESIFLCYSMEDIRAEVFRLQNLFLAHLDQKLFRVLLYPEEHRSGILTLLSPGNSEELVARLGKQGLVLTARSNYIRIAPHFYLSDNDMKEAAELLNREAGRR